MPYQVCVVTGTRADYGLLRELLFRLRDNQEVNLNLIVTGSHLSSLFGNTQEEIQRDGFREYVSLDIPLDDDSRAGIAKAVGAAVCSFAAYFEQHTPDVIVVLGDRYEILAAVIAARMQNLPVAHISGGDVTEGAIDDSIRHAVTKMSQIHFPGCEQSRQRIIQMGEQPDTVFNVGEPGVENCLKTRLIDREELAKNLAFDGILRDYAIVTFHPVTLENGTEVKQVTELFRAMDSLPGLSYLITTANADAGGRAINQLWREEGKKHENWKVVASLGVQRYLSAMKYSKIVLGNSSSGIMEAPAMGIPTVNIGDRQKGRMFSESVISCAPECLEIVEACKKALNADFMKHIHHASPFGDGRTSLLIERHLMDFLRNGKGCAEKHFYDISMDSLCPGRGAKTDGEGTI